MRPLKVCERCGERYEIEPNLRVRSRYCRTCRRAVKGDRIARNGRGNRQC